MKTSGLLQLKDLSKGFGGNKLITGLNYDFQPGIHVITGANGCGKSTLFQLMGGYLKPDRGTVLFKQQTLNGLKPFEVARMGLGMLFQDVRVFKRLSVLDNLLSAFPEQSGETLSTLLKIRAINQAQQQNLNSALGLADDLGLGERIYDLAETLSYGNQKRLAFGRLMAANTSLFLLDELSAGVDPQMRKQLRALLMNIKAQGKTCLMIEHDLEFTAEIADRVLHLEQGCLKELNQVRQLPVYTQARPSQSSPQVNGSSTNILLEVNNVSVAYGQRVVLQQANLHMQTGDITGIFGPNGAGKSSLLRAIAGHLTISKGSIVFKNRSLDKLSIYERQDQGIGYLMQGGAVFPSMTVEENLRLNQRPLNKDALGEVLQLFPVLEPLLSKRSGLLSGGERQQLALAMILKKKPHLLLLDEPSAGIAPSQRRQFFAQLQTLATHGIGILMVEQRLQEPLEIIDKAYFVNQGDLQEIDLENLSDFFLGTAGGVRI